MDGCVRNVSTRGMMITADTNLKVGSYVDIRRGTLAITGRVAWISGRRFGVRTQDSISVEVLVGEPVLKQRPSSDQPAGERRSLTRDERGKIAADRADRSRRLSSSLQYACVALAAVCFAAFAALQVYHSLALPLDSVRSALGD